MNSKNPMKTKGPFTSFFLSLFLSFLTLWSPATFSLPFPFSFSFFKKKSDQKAPLAPPTSSHSPASSGPKAISPENQREMNGIKIKELTHQHFLPTEVRPETIKFIEEILTELANRPTIINFLPPLHYAPPCLPQVGAINSKKVEQVLEDIKKNRGLFQLGTPETWKIVMEKLWSQGSERKKTDLHLSGLEEEEWIQILTFVEILGKGLTEEAQRAKESLYFRKESIDELLTQKGISTLNFPRSLLVTPEGNFYIQLKTKKGKLPQIGRGSSKKVKYALDYHKQELKASGTVITPAEGSEENEINFLQIPFQNPNIITTNAVTTYQDKKGKNKKIVFIQPLYHGDLLKIQPMIKEIFQRAPKEGLIFVGKIAEGLHYLHRSGIIHRDIKLQNILAKYNKKTFLYEPVLSDFGLSYQKDDQSEKGLKWKRKFAGTVAYMPPETEFNYSQTEIIPLDEKADIWSLGLVFYELYFGSIPSWHPRVKVYKEMHGNEKNGNEKIGEESKRAQEARTRMLQELNEIYLNEDYYQTVYPKPQIENSFEYLIWQMLRPRPDQRITLPEIIEKIKILQGSIP